MDVKEILLEMRKYRMGLIQTAEQLRFSYQAIIEGTKPNANTDGKGVSQNNNNILLFLTSPTFLKTDFRKSLVFTFLLQFLFLQILCIHKKS